MEPYLPNYLKGKNRRLVFDLLRERGQMSRAEITRDVQSSSRPEQPVTEIGK